jgi:hypothetical protein
MSHLFIKILFQREKFVFFSKKITNLKKPKKKQFLVGFFRWVSLGFFGWVFYCQPWQQAIAAGGGGSADLQIVYNVEYLFEEDGKEVRKVPIEMNGETIWVESVGGVGGPGGLYKSQDSIIMDLNENDGRSLFFLDLGIQLLYCRCSEYVANYLVRCSNDSFLECSPPTAKARVRFPAGTC